VATLAPVSADEDGWYQPLYPVRKTYIRWTTSDQSAFDAFKTVNDDKPVSINVIEHFVNMYLVRPWGPQFKKKCIGVHCDNAVAVF
jgi:hypothetical protein